MKRSLWLTAILWALAGAGSAVPAFGTADVADPVTGNLAGEDQQPGIEQHGAELNEQSGSIDDWSYESTEFSAFEGDDLIEDDFGLYDEDFDWTVDDADWDAWYEADPAAWEDDDDEDGFWDL